MHQVFLPLILYIADALLWWFAVDAETRWNDDHLTTALVLIAAGVLFWAWIEHYQLLTSDDDD